MGAEEQTFTIRAVQWESNCQCIGHTGRKSQTILNCFLILHHVLVSHHDIVKIEHFNTKNELSCKPWTLINNTL